MTTFGGRLVAALDERGPTCVGIDPHPALLAAWGLTDDADGLRRFALACAEAFGPAAAVVKPQSAFFEAYGAAGIAVLEETVRACRGAGALVLLDVKRGDIGSTMDAYARAYLDPAAPLAADAITLSPYLGVGSLDPAFRMCAQTGAGAFVLALTSNPEGPQFQRARTGDGAPRTGDGALRAEDGALRAEDGAGRPVAQVVVDELAKRNAGAAPVGSLGVVVGATIGAANLDLAGLNGPFLVPGIGAQGGTPDDVRRIFGPALRQVLPSVSREVLRRGPDVAALRAALAAQNDAFAFLRR